MEYQYDNKESLVQLKADLKDISLEDKAYLFLMVVKDNLMNTPPALQDIIPILTKDVAVKLAPSMAEQAGGDVEELWSETIEHMIHGHDTYDAKSAGGWSKDELALFLSHVEERGCFNAPDAEETSGLKM